MPVNTLYLTLAYSCAAPAILGMVYYNRMGSNFHPFCWAMWLSLFTETVHNLIIHFFGYIKSDHWVWNLYSISGNTYILLNIFFYLIFFYRNKIITRKWVMLLIFFCSSFYIGNCFFTIPYKKFMVETSIINNLVVFFLAVKLITLQIFSFKMALYKNPLFIIGCGSSMFCAIFTFTRIIYKFQGKTGFNTFLFDIFRYVNAATYLIFTWAFICIIKEISARKKTF